MNEKKKSIYNIEFNYRGCDYVYNTRTSCLAQFEVPFSEFIPDETEVADLIDAGFIVANDSNEVDSLLADVDNEINAIPNDLELTIVLTENCNFHCIYCYQANKTNRRFAESDMEKLLSQIDILFNRGLQSLSVHYFGGEPLLNLAVLCKLDTSLKVLCSKRDRRFKSYITTNGSLLTQEVLKRLDFNTIQLTFDGNIRNHQAFKNTDDFDYSRLLDTVEMVMKESSSNLMIRFNICKENAKDFPSVIDDVLALNGVELDRVGFKFSPMRNFTSTDEFTELSPRSYAEVDLRLRKHLLKAGKKLIFPKAITQPCKFTVGNAICLGPGGVSYFCTTDFYGRKAKNTLDGFLDNKELRYSVPDICRRCATLPMCLCSCKLLKPENNACISEKYILIDLLKLYLDDPDKWIV